MDFITAAKAFRIDPVNNRTRTPRKAFLRQHDPRMVRYRKSFDPASIRRACVKLPAVIFPLIKR